MSSPEPSRRPCRSLALAAAVMAALALAACNVRPLHAPAPGGRNVGAELAEVELAPVEGRAGQQVRNELEFMFHGGRPSGDTRYLLALRARASTGKVLVRQIRGLPQGRTATLQVTYDLRDKATDSSLFRGQVRRSAPFEVSNQYFANDRAEIDALDRAADEIAEEIRWRVSAYLASEGAIQPGGQLVITPEDDIDRAERRPGALLGSQAEQ